ncbi:MAG: integrase core domain-containing protein [Candidatus Saccharibacteria bacterium]|nr:integrase core domain-containing protein [Candidatus Saccharibacteria bacterium]
MSYCNSQEAICIRSCALKDVILFGMSINEVATKYERNRSTIWRWIKKWQKINENVETRNHYRPSRNNGIKSIGQRPYRWTIPSESSAPRHHPTRISPELERKVLEYRKQTGDKHAAYIQAEMKRDGIEINLSAIKRIIKRYNLQRVKKLKHRTNPKRPKANHPGDLVEIDTIHYTEPFTWKKVYVYTIIDVYTRMTYAYCSAELRPGIAAQVILRAEAKFGFQFKMVQADNGPEFGKYFDAQIRGNGKRMTRHTRPGRPNDNAHIERSNRTIQTECIGHYKPRKATPGTINQKLRKYLDLYNHYRLHSSLEYQTPYEFYERCCKG